MLSKEDNRRLAQLERQLLRDDPEFCARMQPDRPVVAVGTVLADGPPHRSPRAGLPHGAPASGSGCEAHVRERMHRADFG